MRMNLGITVLAAVAFAAAAPVASADGEKKTNAKGHTQARRGGRGDRREP